MIVVNDIITRSPHLSIEFKRKYVREVRERQLVRACTKCGR